ncbi:hypothetical protein AGMMS49936_08480 [Endomicrobiia bacterium]|nr:hypothetical protein AGMMS49936_08480 [Endomicrobiia bacterium]
MLILSWNFRHRVNFEATTVAGTANAKEGRLLLRIIIMTILMLIKYDFRAEIGKKHSVIIITSL